MTALPAALERLLEVQDKVDALRDLALRSAGRSFADLAYANSYDGPAAGAIPALERALRSSGSLALQYTPYGGATVSRRLVAESLRGSHALPFHLRDVVLTPGAMAALNVVFRSLLQLQLQLDEGPGGEVIVVAPCWLDYPLYLVNLGLTPRLVPVDPRTLRLDVGAIAAALTPRTRAVVLSQPANPTGIVYSDGELADLARVLKQAPVPPLLISDECHRDVVFAPHRFVSPLAHYDASCVVYSFGKSLFLQGQRLGYVAVSPQHPDRQAYARLLERLTRVMGFCTPTALMQLAIGDLLAVRPALDGIARRRARMIDGLTTAGYELTPSEATFFLYPRVPGGDDMAFVARAAEAGVFVLPSSLFHHAGYFRVSLTATDDMLGRALERLALLRARA